MSIFFIILVACVVYLLILPISILPNPYLIFTNFVTAFKPPLFHKLHNIPNYTILVVLTISIISKFIYFNKCYFKMFISIIYIFSFCVFCQLYIFIIFCSFCNFCYMYIFIVLVNIINLVIVINHANCIIA